VARAGTDVTVITYGRQVGDALAVAEAFAAENIGVEVLDLRTISPLDTAAIVKSVKKTARAVIMHEAVLSFGPGAEIATRLNEALFGQLKAPVLRVAANDSPVPYSKPLETAYMPSRDRLKTAIEATLGRTSS
jgi:pyruvate/2-oxoglutarate/acetoin dehydrogenase E1 component